ncbi:N-acetylglucosamine kinase [Sphingomonas sp. Tas61C01]|uniref:N-acetylglucosamine kinase n=1 Tax=Sphingomonas sp. Tas61C01 TaxID=3458297 RepID=UPI00403E75EB
MTDLFLGVDGGGTKTEFVCIDGDGHVLAQAFTGTTYHPQAGLEGARARLADGVGAVCGKLGVGPAGLTQVFFGLPAYGEDAPVDVQLAAACGEILGHDRYSCGNDMVCGWAGSLGCEDGINLVAGTGSIAYGERAGIGARSGGWGEIFSDEGSAYWIAIRGLNAFSRMSDGRLPAGPLHGRLAAALSLDQDLDLCARIMGEDAYTRDQIAGLAPIVSEAAAAGDRAAAAILDDAAAELLAMAHALRDRLGYAADEVARLSGSGGVLAGEQRVRNALIAAAEEAELFTWVAPIHSPAVGAAMYARRRRPAS